MYLKLLTIGLATLTLAACGQAGQTQPSPQADWANQSAPIVKPVQLTFGQSHTWPTGDTITVGTPQRKSVTSPYSGRTDNYIVVPVSIHNGTSGVRSGSAYFTSVTINGVPTTYVAMSEDPMTMNRTASVLPGKTLTWDEAYPVSTNEPVTLQIQAMGAAFDPQRPVVFFEGKA